MKFETRFDVGESAWIMEDNKPKEVIISAIEIFYVNTNQDFVKYKAKNAVNPVTWLDNTNLRDEQLYKTKHLLLASLFGTSSDCKGSN